MWPGAYPLVGRHQLYNKVWMEMIEEIGWDVVAVNDILDIREQLTKRFRLDPPDPDYFTRCGPGP